MNNPSSVYRLAYRALRPVHAQHAFGSLRPYLKPLGGLEPTRDRIRAFQHKLIQTRPTLPTKK